VAEGLRSALREHGFEVVGIATSGRGAVSAARGTRPDAVLMDIGLPDIDGLTAGERILAEQPDIKLLALTGLEDRVAIRDAIRIGFHGYVMKHASISEVVASIVAVARSQVVLPQRVASAVFRPERGGKPDGNGDILRKKLTEREREILRLLTQGASGSAIAKRLFLSPNTVRTHVQNILSKLQVHTRLEAVAFATRHGLG
jgi:DNA-binding NarL/FixJ family response regulator